LLYRASSGSVPWPTMSALLVEVVAAAAAVVAAVAAAAAIAETAATAVAAVPFLRSPGYYRSPRCHQNPRATSLYRTPTIDVCSQFAQFLRPSSAPTRTGDAHSIYSTLVLLNRWLRDSSTTRTRTPLHAPPNVATATIAAIFVAVAVATATTISSVTMFMVVALLPLLAAAATAATTMAMVMVLVTAATAVSLLVPARRLAHRPPPPPSRPRSRSVKNCFRCVLYRRSATTRSPTMSTTMYEDDDRGRDVDDVAPLFTSRSFSPFHSLSLSLFLSLSLSLSTRSCSSSPRISIGLTLILDRLDCDFRLRTNPPVPLLSERMSPSFPYYLSPSKTVIPDV